MQPIPLAIVLALLAGCAGLRPEPPPLTASAAVAPAFPVPSASERAVSLARQEWALFGSPVVHVGDDGAYLEFADPDNPTHELQAPMLARVLMYWYAVSRLPIVGNNGELRPWSGAFVSWLMRSAGLTSAEFPPTVLHWDYIERFLQPRDGDRFATRDPAGYAPRVGDLVCNARGDRTAPPDGAVVAASIAGFAQLRRGLFHCELVVAAAAGAIETIGGNVGDTVALTRVPVDPQGLLLPHPLRRWAAVLESRSP
jgi:hypothetical protein